MGNNRETPLLPIGNIYSNWSANYPTKSEGLVPAPFVLILLLGELNLAESVGFVLVDFPARLFLEALLVPLDHPQLLCSVWYCWDWALVGHYNFK